MKVIVCGGRDYADWNRVREVLSDTQPPITHVVQGGAPGADALGKRWATMCNIPMTEVRADWAKHGRAAGPIRNRKMLEEKPKRVIAFPGGKGTKSMTRLALDANVEVLEVAPQRRSQSDTWPDPIAYHRCPVCKKPMKRVETENYGPGWVFDCKCLDADTATEPK